MGCKLLAAKEDPVNSEANLSIVRSVGLAKKFLLTAKFPLNHRFHRGKK